MGDSQQQSDVLPSDFSPRLAEALASRQGQRLLVEAIALELLDYFRGSSVESLVELEARSIAWGSLQRAETLAREKTTQSDAPRAGRL